MKDQSVKKPDREVSTSENDSRPPMLNAGSGNSRSLRKAIYEHCRTCIYDPSAMGTWRQQTALCAVTSCALYSVRPSTKRPIPDCVLDYYGIVGRERTRDRTRTSRNDVCGEDTDYTTKAAGFGYSGGQDDR